MNIEENDSRRSSIINRHLLVASQDFKMNEIKNKLAAQLPRLSIGAESFSSLNASSKIHNEDFATDFP